MKLLLNDEFAPITRSMGFLEIDHQHLAEAYKAWNTQGIRINEVHQQKSCSGGHSRDYVQSTPLSHHGRKNIFIPTRSTWTACFDNLWTGTDCGSLVRYLTKKLKCRGVLIVASPNTVRGEGREAQGAWGAWGMEIYGTRETNWLNRERAVGVYNDVGGWKFIADGEILPFEKPEYYTVKRSKDRFPPELLREYLAALNLFVFDEEFYAPLDKPPAILNERKLFPTENDPSYTLDEVKRYI